MLLRNYQTRLVDNALKALATHGNTLAVAATGAGKTIMLADVLRQMGGKQLVLQHRQELVEQNLHKFKLVNTKAKTGLWTADAKTFRGDTTFAMVQSLNNHIKKIPKLDVICVDEAHHIAAPTFEKIISHAKEQNPNLKLIGFTATPKRTDKKGLRKHFDNICDHITIKELVDLGFLVPPKAFVVSVGDTQQDLAQIKGSDFGDQLEVANILNTEYVNKEVVRHWKEKAIEHERIRPTIIFASTIKHAIDVSEAFNKEGIRASYVHGEMRLQDRKSILDMLRRGKINVLVNVMVLTEGFDFPPISCVVLLRKCSDKSPLIQMAGRGLRTVNPEEYPNIIKKDCIILDFGTSILTHGDLMSDADLGREKEREKQEGKTKTCPKEYEHICDASGKAKYRFPDKNKKIGCGIELPVQTKTCPLCGFVFERVLDIEEAELENLKVDLTEIDILNASPFRYVDLFANAKILMASGFEAWAGVFSPNNDDWYAIGKQKKEKAKCVLIGSKLQAMAAADDFLRVHETEGAAKKTKRWLDDRASEKQRELLNRFQYALPVNSTMNKYEAMCHTNFQFAKREIENVLGV